MYLQTEENQLEFYKIGVICVPFGDFPLIHFDRKFAVLHFKSGEKTRSDPYKLQCSKDSIGQGKVHQILEIAIVFPREFTGCHTYKV